MIVLRDCGETIKRVNAFDMRENVWRLYCCIACVCTELHGALCQSILIGSTGAETATGDQSADVIAAWLRDLEAAQASAPVVG